MKITLYTVFDFQINKSTDQTNKTRGPWATSLTWENSINTYDYIITLIRRRKNPSSSFWELRSSLFEKTLIPFTQGCFLQSLVETVPLVLEKIFQFCQCILLLPDYLPLVKDMALLNKLKSLHPKMLVLSSVETVIVVL